MIDAPPITAKELFESLVPAPPDDTCRTCRFWDKLIMRESGYCDNEETTGVESTNPTEVPVIYPETFGCRFHRPKEAG